MQQGIVASAPHSSFAGYTYDHSNTNNCAAVCVSDQVTLSMNATAGTFVVVTEFHCVNVACNSAAASGDITSISDTGSNTYTSIQYCVGTGGTTQSGVGQWYIQSAAGGTVTITVQYGATKGNYSNLSFESFAGVAGSSPIDTNSTGCAFNSNTVPAVSTTSTLGQTNELIIGMLRNGTSSTYNLPSGYTQDTSASSANLSLIYKTGGTSGSGETINWTQTNGFYAAMIVGLKH